MKNKFKLYSGDGGGCFGAIPAFLNKSCDYLDQFDGFVGTSIHAALSAAYALGIEADVVNDFMVDDMAKVFGRPWWYALKPYGPKWPDTGLNVAIKNLVGPDTTLGDARVPLFITAMNFKHDTPKVFSSLDPIDSKLKMWEVIRCSVAANTYFPTWNPHKDDSDFYTDGGTWANTPSMTGLAACMGQLDISLDDLKIFSVGCGIKPDPNRIQATVDNWNALKMGLSTIDSMFAGGNERAMTYMTRQLLGNNLTRFNEVPLVEGWDMDDASIIPDLLIVASPYVPFYRRALEGFLNGS
jgi:patatin-like phospholipase/acyl hydrolase